MLSHFIISNTLCWSITIERIISIITRRAFLFWHRCVESTVGIQSLEFLLCQSTGIISTSNSLVEACILRIPLKTFGQILPLRPSFINVLAVYVAWSTGIAARSTCLIRALSVLNSETFCLAPQSIWIGAFRSPVILCLASFSIRSRIETNGTGGIGVCEGRVGSRYGLRCCVTVCLEGLGFCCKRIGCYWTRAFLEGCVGVGDLKGWSECLP